MFRRLRSTIRHALDLRTVAKAQKHAPAPQRPVTPAYWAHVASGGHWVCPPHLDVLNRALLRLAVQRLHGQKGRLLVLAPPRHGKSQMCSQYLPGWWLGTFPDDPIILASYEADFAATWGRRARDAFAEHGPSTFGFSVSDAVSATAHWEIAGRRQDTGTPVKGSMTTAGAGGAITGRGAKLFLIDDPIKNSQDAASQAFRDNQWDWFVSVALTRMEPGGSMLMVLTPWHEDDIAHRILAAVQEGDLEPWEVLRLPALAESQDDRDEWAARFGLPLGQPDPIGRRPGEALWPERYSAEALEQRRRTDPYYFESMYQGRPRPRDGGFFKGDWFARTNDLPAGSTFCRAWDFASSETDGDYTAGVLMARCPDGSFVVCDVVRGRWSTGSRDAVIVDTARTDAGRYGDAVRIRGELQPGAAGKDHALAFVRMLAGFDVKCVPASGDKEVRARPFASQAEAGNVRLLRGRWNDEYLRELESFPRGKHDDQVDSSAYSFNELSGMLPAEWGTSPTAGYRGRVA